MRKTYILLICILMTSISAQASVWLQTGAIATRSAEEIPGGPTLSDFRFISASTLAYHFAQGFVLGGQFLYSKSTQSNDYTWAWGPKGGLLLGGFELTGSYLPFAKGTRGSMKLSGGGFAFTLGYHWQLNSFIHPGVLVVYWYSLFDEINESTAFGSYRTTQVLPQFSLAFEF